MDAHGKHMVAQTETQCATEMNILPQRLCLHSSAAQGTPRAMDLPACQQAHSLCLQNSPRGILGTPSGPQPCCSSHHVSLCFSSPSAKAFVSSWPCTAAYFFARQQGFSSVMGRLWMLFSHLTHTQTFLGPNAPRTTLL